MKLKVYLDMCCYNRPFDDQAQILIKLEARAILHIQRAILAGSIELVWSFMLSHENRNNPFIDRRQAIAPWGSIAESVTNPTKLVYNNSLFIMDLGIKQKDAIHIACAIDAGVDYFITTDRKLLNKSIAGIEIINPIDFLRRYEL